jgi:hypothetical protein
VIEETVPLKLVAGDTWRWTRDLSDYPATIWAVTYYFEKADKKFDAMASADGSSHAVSIAAATSTEYPPGRYRWFARAVAGAIVETIEDEEGWLEVLPNPAATGTRDPRSWARRALDAVEATIEGRASSGQLAFSIKDRNVSSFTLTELMDLRKHLKGEVRSEEQGDKAGAGRQIKARLKRA